MSTQDVTKTKPLILALNEAIAELQDTIKHLCRIRAIVEQMADDEEILGGDDNCPFCGPVCVCELKKLTGAAS